MADLGLLNAPAKFRKKLLSEAKNLNISDLVEKLEAINSSSKVQNKWVQFQKNPHVKSNGQHVYSINEAGDATNLLEHFSLEEINAFNIQYTVSKNKEFIFPPDKQSGKISILPDTNIHAGNPGALNALKGNPFFDIDVLTIVSIEAKKYGLSRYEIVPLELVRGFQSIQKRLYGVKKEYITEVNALYTFVWNYFTHVINNLNANLQKHPTWSNERIAGLVSKHDYEVEIYEKQVEKLRADNALNIIADCLLVSASYVLNMADTENVVAVVSQDFDLENISQLMRDEIMPLYVAKSAFSLLPRTEQYLSRFLYPEKQLITLSKSYLESWEHGSHSRSTGFHSAGIVYHPHTDRFNISIVPQAYVNFMSTMGALRSGEKKLDICSEGYFLTPKDVMTQLVSKLDD